MHKYEYIGEVALVNQQHIEDRLAALGLVGARLEQ